MKICLITGGNSGIGYWACYHLASSQFKVIMLCRNEKLAQESCTKIIKETKNNNVSYIIADLSDIQSVKNTIKLFLTENDRLDVLINNAADFDISIKNPIITKDGLEKQFATNVVAPFLLSELLIPTLKKSKGKIINISTKGLCVYQNIKLNFDNLKGEIKYSPSKTYYQNKLALLMFSLYQRDLYKDITIHCIRVTNVKIDINKYQNINKFLITLYKLKSKSAIHPKEMAKVYEKLTLENFSGFLYDENCNEVKANKFAYLKDSQIKLYNLLLNYLD